jgi:hypothetical protein
MSKRAPFYLRSEPNPENDPADWLPGFETKEQAAERHAARSQLMSTGKNTMSQLNFYWCKPECPCDSGACPFCMREFRRWWVDLGITLLEQSFDPLCAASLVHHTLSHRPGTLHDFDLDKAKRQLARHIDRAGLGNLIAIGGFDFVYSQPAGGTGAYWQPHTYVIFQGAEKEIIKEALSRFYPAVPNIRRPVRIRVVGNPMKALSYSMKDVFCRRSSYTDSTGRANTRAFWLARDAERELLTYLDRLHPVDRIFLKNVRREGVNLTAKQPSAHQLRQAVRLSSARSPSRGLSPRK